MIVQVTEKDINAAASLAALLWGHHSAAGLEEEFRQSLLQGDAQFFLKYDGDVPVGFAQCQLRHDYVEGTQTSPVGYLEGIFVKEEHRHRGYAKALLEECKKWAKANGCSEFASDCEITNESSFHFHKAVGFIEANRIICFTQDL